MKEIAALTMDQSLIIGIIAGFCIFVGWMLRSYFAGKKLREAEQRAKELTEFANREADSRKKET